MNKTEDIATLERSLIDAESKVKTVLSDIVVHEKEIKFLQENEKTLAENVKCLKSTKIIAVAQEYKKTKEELKKTKSRIAILTNDCNHLKKTVLDIEDFIKKTGQKIDKIRGLEKNNVLQFKRGEKDG